MSIVFGPNGFFGYGYLTSTAMPDSSSPTPELDSQDATKTVDRTSDGLAASGVKPSKIPRQLGVPATSQPGSVAGWWSTFSSSTPYPYAVTTTTATGTASVTDNDTTSLGPASSKSTNKPTEFNKPLAIRALISRHNKWKNPRISAILNYVESSSSSSPTPISSHQIPPLATALDACYPTWTTPELPHWTAHGRAVLVGDAAHALQPSSGQGACQALEDAEALALFLRYHLRAGGSTGGTTATATASATAIAKAVEQYETLRKPRVHTIYARSQQMSRMKGDMGVVLEWIMYAMIYLMSKFLRIPPLTP